MSDATYSHEDAMNSSELSAVLTIDDLADYLKISKSMLYKLAHEGALMGQKLRRHWRFYRQVVDQWRGQATKRSKKPR
jgi:excisionase family DNA binding protein